MLYMKHAKFLVSIFLCLVLGELSSAQSSTNDGKALLQKVDSLVTFESNDFAAEYSIVQEVPGEGLNTTDAVMFRRDKAQEYLILILKPDKNKGQGYLKMDQNIWFYDPITRQFTFTAAKERFQNSNARNSDFTRSTLAQDYEVKSQSKEKLGRFDCDVLVLEANNDRVAFPKMKIWISTDDSLLRKSEDYSLSGQLIRTTAIPSYQKIGERYIPVSIVIVDALRGKNINGKFVGEKTTINISKPSLKALPDSVFSKAYLERVAK